MPKHYDDYIKEKIEPLRKGTFLHFEGNLLDRDVYNITAPFTHGDELFLAARVEPRESIESSIHFFKHKQDHVWELDETAPHFHLEDPAIAHVRDELILSGIETYPLENSNCSWGVGWKTKFFLGKDLYHLTPFTEGPTMMKDIRLKELPDGRIFVLTRPQGEVGGLGKIGWIIIDSLDELNAETMSKAKILENQIDPTCWIGANQAMMLSEDKIGILCHIASKDEHENEQGFRSRHYAAAVFTFDVKTETASDLKVVATRSDFPDGPSKAEDLVDVIFTGGVTDNSNGTLELFVGLSDATAGSITIPYPF
jgi:hypothetical protein